MGTLRTVVCLVGVLLVAGCSGAPPASAPTAAPSAPATAGSITPPSREFRQTGSGVYANLYLPSQPGRARAVVVLGGSEGGLAASSVTAAAFAQQGFAAMAVAYFHEPGLPATLSNIPIEYFVRAARLLAAQPEVDPAHVAVMGTSRGSEAAALLAAYAPDVVHGAVLESATSFVHAGYPDGGPSWTWHGAALPFYASMDAGDEVTTADPQALLPIGRIPAPIVTVCGGEDSLGPSCQDSDQIGRLAAPHAVTELRYPLAGHAPIALSLLSDLHVQDLVARGGGLLPDNVAAGHDAFAHVVAALRGAP